MFPNRGIHQHGPIDFCESMHQDKFTYEFKETSKVLFSEQQQVCNLMWKSVKQGIKTAKEKQDTGGRKLNVLLPGYKSKFLSLIYSV